MTERVDGGGHEEKVVDRIEKCSDERGSKTNQQRGINDVDVLKVDRRQKSEVANAALANVLVGQRGKAAGGEANGGS